MTGYTVHTGTSKKYAAGWDQIFAAKSKKAQTGEQAKSSSKTAAASKKRGRSSSK